MSSLDIAMLSAMAVDIPELASLWAEARALSTPIEGDLDRDTVIEIWKVQATEILTVLMPTIEAQVRADVLAELKNSPR